MIYAVTMYAGKCDNCGRQIKLGGGEFVAYGEDSHVVFEMQESDWLIGDKQNGHEGKHYCWDCWTTDEDDKIVILKKGGNEK